MALLRCKLRWSFAVTSDDLLHAMGRKSSATNAFGSIFRRSNGTKSLHLAVSASVHDEDGDVGDDSLVLPVTASCAVSSGAVEVCGAARCVRRFSFLRAFEFISRRSSAKSAAEQGSNQAPSSLPREPMALTSWFTITVSAICGVIR